MAAPTITSISKNTINPGQSLDLVGTNFGASGASLWLADADNFATANLVEFTVDSHDDTIMSATVTPRNFGDGTYYLFVENSGAETNASGEEIELVVSEQKLFFGWTTGIPQASSGNQGIASDFQSSYTGKLTSIKTYGSANGNMKLAIYLASSQADDNASLLYSDLTGSPLVASTWSVYNFNTPLSCVASTWYRLMTNTDVLNGVQARYGTGINYYYKVATYSTWAPDDPVGVLSPYDATKLAAAYGYATPTIASKDKSIITIGQTLSLTGDDFMSSGAKVYLADVDNFATATKVEQIITSQTNTTISFTVDFGSLDTGTNYIFIETDLGLTNASGESIVLYYPPVISVVSPTRGVNGTAGIILSGSNFLTSGATLELCNNSDYSLATEKISQTITDQTDSSITFTLVTGSGYKDHYLFITTSEGHTSLTGETFSVGRQIYARVTRKDGDKSNILPIVLYE